MLAQKANLRTSDKVAPMFVLHPVSPLVTRKGVNYPAVSRIPDFVDLVTLSTERSPETPRRPASRDDDGQLHYRYVVEPFCTPGGFLSDLVVPAALDLKGALGRGGPRRAGACTFDVKERRR